MTDENVLTEMINSLEWILLQVEQLHFSISVGTVKH